MRMLSLLIVYFATLAKAQAICADYDKCSDCIQDFGCTWCSEIDLTNKHCFDKNDPSNKCAEKNLISPKSESKTVKNKPLEIQPNKPPVQIKPQEINLKLRRGETYDLKFQYAQAHNYPIDLYYIMDLSQSMKQHKTKLAQIGDELIFVMKNITNNFKIGFGSFVDKTDSPYISVTPHGLAHPCLNCAPAYTFKNHMSLLDGTGFSEEVQKAKVSGNLDTPEGGFDALMQAMVCKDKIGWRDHATHMIVFSTDAPFHIAGDGKLAGVVEPNDATCHLTNNTYTHALEYDYPSISHINHIAKENGFYILFNIAPHPSTYQLYQKLQGVIENSAIQPLERNSKIPQFIRSYYYNISNFLKIKHTPSENFEITYTSDCASKIENGCNDVTVGKTINFTANIKALKCPENNKETIYIQPGQLSEKLKINLEVLCDCNCVDNVGQAKVCNGHGKIVCGICSCNSGFYGKQCECSGKSNSLLSVDLNKCRKTNDSEPCSGVGACNCGVCDCEKRSNPNEKIYGKYCECDNYSCPKNVEMCSGNGKCDCGKCVCNVGWKGDACECVKTNETCTVNAEVCNKKGVCECGSCKCEQGYYGKYCEECATCSGGKCSALKPCVECKVHNFGDYKENCDVNCAQYPIIELEQVADDDDEESENVKICRFLGKNNCKYVFRYIYAGDNKIVIEAEKDMQCPVPINLPILVLSLIGSILLIGILTVIIWKLVTSFHDRREYAKFENERERAKWNRDDNPLFKSPVSNFRNPTFRLSVINKK